MTTAPAQSLDIELRDFAPDRVERQRAYQRGEMPLPKTPNLKSLDQRLAAKGLVKGRPIFIRVFKASSELELWMQKGDRFELLDTYPICHWTGTLGPKLREGDRQSPEGFYSVVNRQMRLVGRWQRAFNLGFPNPHDQHAKRTGSFILIHGGCSSVGCYAMTEQVQDEIYLLADAAIKGGQQRFHVQVFPFRMTPEAMEVFEGHTWLPFWQELKPGYDSFERTRIPPRVGLCGQRYHVSDGEPGEVGEAAGLHQLQRNGGACAPVTSASVAAVSKISTASSLVTTGSNSEERQTQSPRKPVQRAQNISSGRANGASQSGNSGSARPADWTNDVPDGYDPKLRNSFERSTSGG